MFTETEENFDPKSRLKKIYHKGKEIYYGDYRGLNEAQTIEVLKEAEKVILAENKPYLQLSNISGSYATPEYMKAVKKLGEKTKELAKKAAIVGIKGAKKVLLSAYNKVFGGKLKPFDTEEEAKEYLVSEEE